MHNKTYSGFALECLSLFSHWLLALTARHVYSPIDTTHLPKLNWIPLIKWAKSYWKVKGGTTWQLQQSVWHKLYMYIGVHYDIQVILLLVVVNNPILSRWVINPQHACTVRMTITIVAVSVCLFVTTLAAAWRNFTLKLRYDYLQCSPFLIFDLWIFAKLFCSEVMVWFS